MVVPISDPCILLPLSSFMLSELHDSGHLSMHFIIKGDDVSRVQAWLRLYVIDGPEPTPPADGDGNGDGDHAA